MSNSKFPIIDESDPPFIYGRDLTRIAFLIVLAFSGGMTIFFIKFKYSDQLLERAENSWTLFLGFGAVLLAIFLTLIFLIVNFSVKPQENKVRELKKNLILKWVLLPEDWLKFWEYNYKLAKKSSQKQLVWVISIYSVGLSCAFYFLDYSNFHEKSLIHFIFFVLLMSSILSLPPIFTSYRLLKVSKKSLYPVYFGKNQFYVNGQFMPVKTKLFPKIIWVELFKEPLPYLELTVEMWAVRHNNRTSLRIPLSRDSDLQKEALQVARSWVRSD